MTPVNPLDSVPGSRPGTDVATTLRGMAGRAASALLLAAVLAVSAGVLSLAVPGTAAAESPPPGATAQAQSSGAAAPPHRSDPSVHPAAEIGDPGLSAQQEAAIDEIFAPLDRDDAPGCVVGVSRDGELAYARGYGLANLDHRIPLGPESVFYLASVTKQFTSAVIARLVLEGRLSLDDEVRDHIPELPDYGAPVRIRHLLHNISGIRDYLDLMRVGELRFEDVFTEEGILDLIARQEELNFEPGSRYLYSNSNFFVLSLVVERVTGLTLREYGDRHFFTPLGMENTHFHDDRTDLIPNRVLGYAESEEGGFRLSHMYNTDWIGSGAGNLHSTVGDLARWDGNLLDPEVGSREWVELTYTPGVLNDGDTISYAFGVQVGEHQGLPTARHGGGWMGFSTHYLRFPEQATAILTLCNVSSANPSRLSERVAAVVLREEFEANLRPLEGRYRSHDVDTEYRIRVEEGELVLYRNRARDSAVLRPAGERGHYRSEWRSERESRPMDFRFERNDGGEVTGFTVDTGRALGIRFRPVEEGAEGGI